MERDQTVHSAGSRNSRSSLWRLLLFGGGDRQEKHFWSDLNSISSLEQKNISDSSHERRRTTKAGRKERETMAQESLRFVLPDWSRIWLWTVDAATRTESRRDRENEIGFFYLNFKTFFIQKVAHSVVSSRSRRSLVTDPVSSVGLLFIFVSNFFR